MKQTHILTYALCMYACLCQHEVRGSASAMVRSSICHQPVQSGSSCQHLQLSSLGHACWIRCHLPLEEYTRTHLSISLDVHCFHVLHHVLHHDFCPPVRGKQPLCQRSYSASLSVGKVGSSCIESSSMAMHKWLLVQVALSSLIASTRGQHDLCKACLHMAGHQPMISW